MAQPEPPPSNLASDQVVPSGTTVAVSGSENTTISGINTGGGDLTVASGAPVIQGDMVTGDKVGGDKVYGDKITQTIQQAPKPKPTLPAHTPNNLPQRTTSAERFVGRNVELEKLEGLLASESSRVYLTGMGGVGKSELAIQHAYESFDLYRGGILRLDARQGLDAMALQVVTFFRGAFPDVVLPEDKSPTDLLPLCWSQWPAGANPPEPVLLILDDQEGNTDGYAAERKLLEGLPTRFKRLITQRETAPATALSIDLPLLQRDASLELLALQAGEGNTSRFEAEKQAADALCAEVGDLPLALVLLGARLAERPDLQLAQLLADLQAKGAEAKALSKAHPELGARHGVVEALLISWEPLNEPAKSLVLLLAVMAPALIPWELVESCRLPEQEVEEGSAFGDQQAELLRTKLLDRKGPRLYQLHPLVRQFMKLQGKAQPVVVGRWRQQLAAAVAEVSRERFPQELTVEQVEAVQRFVPHIKQVADTWAQDLSERDLLWPASALGRFHKSQAAFTEALQWYQHAVQTCEERLGPEHPDIAAALNNLAELLQTINRLVEAELTYRRALAIDEANYGPNDPEVAPVLNNLAGLLMDTNRLAEAESLYQRALAIAEASYGPNHPHVATALNGLAQLLKDTNRPEAAEPLMRRVAEIFELSYGPDHPNVAIGLNNLAELLKATNRLAEAEPLMRRVAEIFELSYGPDHPNVAIGLNNLAQLLGGTNRMEEAEPLMNRALAIDEACYGSSHPIVAIRLNNLAELLKAANRLVEAEPLYHQALAIAEASYGPTHPVVANYLGNLAVQLKATNRLAEAEPLYRRALAINEASYGPNHPNVATDLNNLALLLNATNRVTEAELLMRRALAINEASYGPNHPIVSIRLNNLAQLMMASNRLVDAEPLMERAVAILYASLGVDHLETQTMLGNYIILLEKMGLTVPAIQAKLVAFVSP